MSTHEDSDARKVVSRRRVIQAGISGAALALVPGAAAARPSARPAPRPSNPLINRYTGAIPMTFPLAAGTYQSPVGNNWHAGREGQLYTWSHRDGRTQRAHDGVDVYPLDNAALPAVFAPFEAIVAAVCVRSDNTVDATVTYQVDPNNPPPWNYSQGIDDVANLPLYGNFIWLQSTATDGSKGYFAFYCHLQPDSVI